MKTKKRERTRTATKKTPRGTTKSTWTTTTRMEMT